MFVANTSYRTLAKLQTNDRRREIELVTQAREDRETQVRDRMPVRSESVTKRPKPAKLRVGDQKGRTCGKCDRGHEGPCWSGTTYYLYGKERNLAKDYPKGFQVCFNCNQTGHLRV